ncbi:MAG: Cof-type HAD-IIB family hydrolase [Actinomycetota bacterium]|nr:Cof-type HAD-IIB family hydrolase [Actinomycetota bacterium]
MKVRMVASDLDGTLLRSDNTVSPRTRSAIASATDQGLLIAFVTGRPPRWLTEVAEATGHRGVAVAANGAVLYDLATEQILSIHAIDAADLAALTDELRTAFPDACFAVEYGDGFGAEPGYVHDWQINPRLDSQGRPMTPPVVADLASITSKPGVKLLAKDRSADSDAFVAAAQRLLAGRATVTHSSSYGLLEIAAPGVTKATGLAELAARHGITAEEIVAIGDMPNDVPMLEWAGRSYAVADAHPAARAAADQVLGSNDDDAVAALIESLLA